MNKKCILTICLVVIGVLGMKAQNSIVALHHEGKVTLYAGSKTQEAMDASVKGDTLYLSDGTFAGFNVTHGIVVMGSGENTVFSGDITITGTEENKEVNDCTFSGLNLLNNFYVDATVNGLSINQCQMRDFEMKVNSTLDAAIICMSFIKNVMILNYEVYSLEVLNSKIKEVKGDSNVGCAVFTNCNVGAQSGNKNCNTYRNCIVGLHAYAYGVLLNCLYTHTYISIPFDYCTITDSYKTEANGVENILDDKYNSIFSDEELKSNGYLGTDGTVVGITGGVRPYTLEVFTPHVVEHTIDVDNVNATLKVTLKMAGDAN